MNTPWLTIVGIGDDGLNGIGAVARTLIDSAQVLIGGERHLAMVADDGRERLCWPSPLQGLLDEIEKRRGQSVCILASGDPMCYGIGVTLCKRFAVEEMLIVPAPSAFSLGCARLGWALADTDCLTLHGRPLETLHGFLQPGARLLLLSHDRTTPHQVQRDLQAMGFGASSMWVLEHMGGAAERISRFTANEVCDERFSDLNTIAIEVATDENTAWLPRTFGLPDTAFLHDGQLTKRDVRACTLTRLKPAAGQTLWDVGAGAGSIAIEWMRSARNARAIAIEANPLRVGFARSNALALGTPDLTVIHGHAPQALRGLAEPDAIFIGGGLGNHSVLETCWEALGRGGRLVANAVTIDSEALLLAWYKRCGGELARISLAQATPLGKQIGWRALAPVTQYAVSK